MKVIFQINGGIGKSVAATAVCKAIKKQYPKHELIVLTGYPDVFINNPVVDRCYSSNSLQYFYSDHVENREVIYMLQEPYLDPAFIRQEGHLVKVWCEMNGVAYNGELPEVYLSYKEKMEVGSLIKSNKPFLILQTSGGMPNQTDKYSWPRDMPAAIAQKVVNAVSDRYGVVHIRRQDQLALNNVDTATADFRPLCALISMSEKRLFIDSFAQHAAAALNLPSVVFWIANLPSQFGYELHNNIIANPPTIKPGLKNAIFNKNNIIGPASDFPYNSIDEIISAEVLIEAILNPIPKQEKTKENKKAPPDNGTS